MSTAAVKKHPVVQSKPKKEESVDIEVRLSDLMETLSKGFLIFIVAYSIMIIPSLKRLLEFFREKDINPPLEEYWWMVPGFLLSFFIYKICTTVIIQKCVPIINPINYRQGETPEKRLNRLGTYIYGTVYYTLSFGLLYYLTYGSRYCPVSMGGTLDTKQGIAIWPYEVDRSVRIFYMLTLGHHIERAIYELTVQFHSKTFYIMVFHHFLTIGLIFLSFFMRHLVYGIPILLTHDFNDIFLCSSRFFRETRYPTLASFLFVLLMISWIYTRIYTYMAEVLYGIYCNLFEDNYFLKEFYFTHLFFPPALVLLLIINIYWGFQIIRVAVTRFVKKKEGLPFEDKKSKTE